MANNRIYFICRQCEADEKPFAHSFEDVVVRPFFGLAKWYPGGAWYTNRKDNLCFNEWMEFHAHGKNDEFPFRFEYEIPEKVGSI